MSTKALMLAIGLGVFLVAGPANAAVDPGNACKESKAKATGKKAFDLMKAFGKNIKKADSLKLESDISKAESKYNKAFSTAEGKGGCRTIGDAPALEVRVNLEVCRIVDSVGPATCGNNCRGVGEECDGTDADQCITQLCIPVGDPSGDECKCQGCGDGILIAGEQCDEGTANGTAASCCNTDCTLRAASEACTDTDGNVCTVAGCNGVSGACDQGHISTPASTVCPDTDGNVCTTAGCDGAGACDQGHISAPASTVCPDTDGNDCTTAGCDGAGVCNQGHILIPASTPCTSAANLECADPGCDGAGVCDPLHFLVASSTPCVDTDGNVCTIAGCDGAGACDQGHILPASDPCPDTDGNDCTTAGCNGAGACDQGHILIPASTPCTSAANLECANPGCDGAGVCDPLHFLEPSSTVCGDTDGNVCTIAGCDGGGACDQSHVQPNSNPCPDTDGNVCTTAGCNGAGACDQNHIFAPPSEPCPDTDGNVCTTAGCNGLGVCNQSHILAPDSSVCPDTDGNVCTVAGCNGLGACDQLHILPSGTACGSPANTDCTNPDTCLGGICLANHEPSSTPCTDTDGNVCTVAGCNGLGVCNQGHILPASDPCPDTDGNDCTIAGCNGAGVCDQGHVPVPESTPCTSAPDLECADPGCDGLGVCDPLHFPVAPSTPCTDTDGNVCTVAGCNGLGVCNQSHVFAPPSEPCLDIDGNVCTTAGCNGLGVCNQSHILAPASYPCPDTDGNDCTTAGCDGLGTCYQLHVLVGNSTPCTDTDGNDCTTAGCDGAGACDQSHILEPPSTLCGGGAGECSTEHCDGAGTCVGESDCCAGLDCSEGECDLLSFETGIASGIGGVLELYACSNYSDRACADDNDCNFGTCFTLFHKCWDGVTLGVVPCNVDADCVGTCVEYIQGNLPLDLKKGGLYTGGGGNAVPLPFPVPDQGLSYTSVTDCNSSTGELTLGPTTPGDLEGVAPGCDDEMTDPECGRHCTQGRTCSGGGNDGLHCVLASDCPGGSCKDNCVFGPPLPIPNAGTAATSVCAVNVIDEDASGTAQCDGGDSDLSTPLRSVIYLNGDLLKSSTPPDLPGVQPCPLCVRICSGGTKNGLPCRPDNPYRACAGGSNVGRPCTDNSDCPSSTCAPARTEYSSCISGGGTCPSTSQCLKGPNDGDPCTPGTSTSDLLGDAQDSYPTSHDCENDPLASITNNIGGLPINFALTTGQLVSNAEDRAQGARVFCGFCRDVVNGASLCFEGSTSGGCPAAIPPATGNAVPCTSDADCVDADTYESCVQRNPGAFSESAATRMTVEGSTDGGCLGDGGLHGAELVSLFCVPPTFDATVDAAGDLPGPGAALLAGEAQLD